MLSSLVVIVVPSDGLKAFGKDLARYFNFIVNTLADSFSTTPALIKSIFLLLFAIWFFILVFNALRALIRGGNEKN